MPLYGVQEALSSNLSTRTKLEQMLYVCSSFFCNGRSGLSLRTRCSEPNGCRWALAAVILVDYRDRSLLTCAYS